MLTKGVWERMREERRRRLQTPEGRKEARRFAVEYLPQLAGLEPELTECLYVRFDADRFGVDPLSADKPLAGPHNFDMRPCGMGLADRARQTVGNSLADMGLALHKDRYLYFLVAPQVLGQITQTLTAHDMVTNDQSDDCQTAFCVFYKNGGRPTEQEIRALLNPFVEQYGYRLYIAEAQLANYRRAQREALMALDE